MALDWLLVRPANSEGGWWTRMSTQPLGLLYLAAVLKRAGHRVRVVDGVLDRNWKNSACDALRAARPDAIGVSLLSSHLDAVADFTGRIRRDGYDGLIVGGGPGATYADDATLNRLDFDIVTQGEAEDTIGDLARAMDDRSGVDDVPGIRFRCDGGYVSAPARPLRMDLDELPMPDQEVSPLPRYFGRPSMDLMFRDPRWASIMTSRSCFFGCTFCAQPLGKKLRERSAENVMAELDDYVGRWGVREVQIVDDRFNSNPDHVRRVCDALMEKPYRLHLVFPNGLRLDMLDDDLIDRLVRAGMDRILAPIESGSPERQKSIKKHLDLRKATAAIREMRRRGVLIRATVMLGFPDETKEEMERSIRVALDSGAHQLSIHRVIPLHGSKLRREAVRRGLGDVDSEHDYISGKFNLSAVPEKTIRRLIRWAVIRSLSPQRLLTTLRIVPRNGYTMYARVLASKLAGI
ncbi:MAG: B12-binding domain-containing radical SAM protein [Deltaproteobacteria bacterium]|nr:B12-binding domain-containing radical SAM protein [Deltaproteobacteria bacterium]